MGFTDENAKNISSRVIISPFSITSQPALQIRGTIAYCVGRVRSGNSNDEISVTITLKRRKMKHPYVPPCQFERGEPDAVIQHNSR